MRPQANADRITAVNCYLICAFHMIVSFSRRKVIDENNSKHKFIELCLPYAMLALLLAATARFFCWRTNKSQPGEQRGKQQCRSIQKVRERGVSELRRQKAVIRERELKVKSA